MVPCRLTGCPRRYRGTITARKRGHRMPSGNLAALHRHKYAALLVVLLALLADQSFDAQLGAETFVSDVFRTVLGVSVLLVVFERPRERAGMAAIFFAEVVIGWGHDFAAVSLDHALALTWHALVSVFFWVAVWVILREIFRTPRVGAENVFGAICGYLIAGEAWAGVNAFTYLLMPATYSIDPAVKALLANWHGRVALFSYYSFAQLLSIGYADVTPVRAPATTLSLFATLFGVFYTAVVVSQLVGMAPSGRRATPSDE